MHPKLETTLGVSRGVLDGLWVFEREENLRLRERPKSCNSASASVVIRACTAIFHTAPASGLVPLGPAFPASFSVAAWAQVLFPANGVVQLLVARERRAL